MLDVSDLHFSYHAHREVLKGVSFSVNAGEIVCLLGSNGTGKTTLLRCLLGFSKPQSGTVLADGKPVATMSAKQRAHHMAYVPQSSSIAFPYLAREVVLMGRVSHLAPGARHAVRDKEATLQALRHLQIEHLADRRYQELSGGEKQMVLVARALAQQPRLLGMDEPCANLDLGNQVVVLRRVRELVDKGLAVVITSHDPNHAFLLDDDVACMHRRGGVRSGAARAVLTPEVLAALYGVDVGVGLIEGSRGQSGWACVPFLDGERMA